jgi:hypothetical protein
MAFEIELDADGPELEITGCVGLATLGGLLLVEPQWCASSACHRSYGPGGASC